jgi:hypothetical protein
VSDELEDEGEPGRGGTQSCPSSLLRMAQLMSQVGDQLYEIRRAGPAGETEDLPAWFVDGEPVTLELRSRPAGRAVVRWSDEGRIDIAFDAPVAGSGDAGADEIDPRRCARFTVSADARLCFAGIFHPVRIEDISTGGMRIAIDGPACAGAQVLVTPDGLAAIAGTVRWQQDGRAGIAFDAPLELSRLAAWLERRP